MVHRGSPAACRAGVEPPWLHLALPPHTRPARRSGRGLLVVRRRTCTRPWPRPRLPAPKGRAAALLHEGASAMRQLGTKELCKEGLCGALEEVARVLFRAWPAGVHRFLRARGCGASLSHTGAGVHWGMPALELDALSADGAVVDGGDWSEVGSLSLIHVRFFEAFPLSGTWMVCWVGQVARRSEPKAPIKAITQ